MTRTRQNLNIELVEGNKDKLEDVRGWNGMTQKELVGRLINWFCAQDRVIQQVILGQIPDEIAPDVAQLMLRRLAEKATGKALVGEIPESRERAERESIEHASSAK